MATYRNGRQVTYYGGIQDRHRTNVRNAGGGYRGGGRDGFFYDRTDMYGNPLRGSGGYQYRPSNPNPPSLNNNNNTSRPAPVNNLTNPRRGRGYAGAENRYDKRYEDMTPAEQMQYRMDMVRREQQRRIGVVPEDEKGTTRGSRHKERRDPPKTPSNPQGLPEGLVPGAPPTYYQPKPSEPPRTPINPVEPPSPPPPGFPNIPFEPPNTLHPSIETTIENLRNMRAQHSGGMPMPQRRDSGGMPMPRTNTSSINENSKFMFNDDGTVKQELMDKVNDQGVRGIVSYAREQGETRARLITNSEIETRVSSGIRRGLRGAVDRQLSNNQLGNNNSSSTNQFSGSAGGSVQYTTPIGSNASTTNANNLNDDSTSDNAFTFTGTDGGDGGGSGSDGGTTTTTTTTTTEGDYGGGYYYY